MDQERQVLLGGDAELDVDAPGAHLGNRVQKRYELLEGGEGLAGGASEKGEGTVGEAVEHYGEEEAQVRLGRKC